MSQVRKPIFITLVLLFSVSLLSGCGISGPLYAPGTGADAANAKPVPVTIPTVKSMDNNVTNKTSSGAAE